MANGNGSYGGFGGGTLFPGLDDPNENADPACQTTPSAVSSWHNFSRDGPLIDTLQACDLATFVSAAVVSIAILAAYAWRKRDYDRTRVRPWLVPVFAFLAVWAFFVASTLSVAIGWWNFPCWLQQVSAILVVPFATLGMLYRQSYFLLLNRFSVAVQLYGPGLLEAEAEDADSVGARPSSSRSRSRSRLASMWWSLAAVVDAALVVARPIPAIPKRSTSSAIASLEPTPTTTLSREEQLHAVRTLRFVLTVRGQFLFALLTSAPFAVIALVVGVLGDAAGYLGCRGCNILDFVVYTVVALAAIMVAFGSVLAVRTHGVSDPWGFVLEGRWTLADLIWSLVFYVLVSQRAIPGNVGGFDTTQLVLVGLLANLAHCTLYGLWLASLVEQPGGDARARAERKQRRDVAKTGEEARTDGQPSNSVCAVGAAGRVRLDDVLSQPKLLEAFAAYVGAEFASENLSFVQCAVSYTHLTLPTIA